MHASSHKTGLLFATLLIWAFAALPEASASRKLNQEALNGNASSSSGPLDMRAQVGYVEVRDGANVFWWLERSINSSVPFAEQPLVIWLQGGPGYPSTGNGNFELVGTYDIGWVPRETTWARKANLLFIDSPVGTGFSYVQGGGEYAESDDQVAEDLLETLKGFLLEQPEFNSTPIYINGQSYGGKIAVVFARKIVEAVAAEELDVNFQGVALDSAWISPNDFLQMWPEMLHAMSLVDSLDLQRLNQLAAQLQMLVDAANWPAAFMATTESAGLLSRVTDNVSLSNVLKHNVPHNETVYNSPQMNEWMNGEVKQMLTPLVPESVPWVQDNVIGFSRLNATFMQDVVADVAWLLDNDVRVVVYNGQLDLICCTLGVDRWVSKLPWSWLGSFHDANRTVFRASTALSLTELDEMDLALGSDQQEPMLGEPRVGPWSANSTVAFRKQFRNLETWTVLRAGHDIAHDQPVTSLMILHHMLNDPESWRAS